MTPLANPLRLTNGFLRRVEEPEAVLMLIRIMAMTPKGSWPACSSFGIRDLLEDSSKRGAGLAGGVRQVNEGLRDMGIDTYWLESLEWEEGSKPEAGLFRAVLCSKAGGQSFLPVKISVHKA